MTSRWILSLKLVGGYASLPEGAAAAPLQALSLVHQHSQGKTHKQ